jgi:hypothetical protein
MKKIYFKNGVIMKCLRSGYVGRDPGEKGVSLTHHFMHSISHCTLCFVNAAYLLLYLSS